MTPGRIAHLERAAKRTADPAKAAWFRERLELPEGEKPLGLPVLVPYPPPLDLKPKSRRAVVTVAAGELGEALLAVSGPLMERYAARLGADFVVSRWPGHPHWPMSSKYGLAPAFDHYERIIYADSDVLFRPGCVDLFAACEADELGLVDEMHWHKKAPQHGILDHYARLRAKMGYPVLSPAFYCNAGVVVASRQHRALFEPPTEPIPAGHLSEQELLNARVNAAVDAGTVKLKLLPRECNYQYWTNLEFRSAPANAVLHLSGMKDRSSRVGIMRAWAECPEGMRPGSLKPGRELKRTTNELGLGGIGCGCNQLAAQMDRWGPWGCREHAQELIRGPLLEVSVRAFMLEPTPAFFDPERIPESLLEYVIARSEKPRQS